MVDAEKPSKNAIVVTVVIIFTVIILCLVIIIQNTNLDNTSDAKGTEKNLFDKITGNK